MGRIASPGFVGRATELAALDDALHAAEQGQTTTVLIGGDAGVGKTRLLQAWNELASGRGARIATGSCIDLGETGPAYTPVIEALRDLLGAFDPAGEEALLGQDRTVLARLVPELGRDTGRDANGRLRATFAQTRLFERLADVLQRAAVPGPLVLELEDIHWADRSSQAFLLYLVEMAQQSNLLLIGTYRPEAADTDQAFRTTLTQLLRRPRVGTLLVAPFDRDELQEQLTGILGGPPSTALLAAIEARSEGNPLFAEELAAAGDPRIDLPASVGASTASRLHGLSADARTVLRAASVVGRSATYDVLRRVTGLSDSALDASLRDAIQARLLEALHVGEAFRFRHALLQEAIYEESLPGERRRLHGAVAAALSADADRPPDDPDLAPRLARHWYEAREYARAFLASSVAAEAADRQAAYAEAATHYERILELWDRADAADRRLSRAEVSERAGWSAFLAADYERAMAHGRSALAELALAPDDSVKIRVLERLSWAQGRQGVERMGFDTLRVLAQMDPDGRPTADRLAILIARVRIAGMYRPGREALEAARPLVEQARRANDMSLYGAAASVLAEELKWYDTDAALEVLEPVLQAAERAGHDVVVVDLIDSRCDVLLAGRRFEQLVGAASAAADAAERAGLGRWARPFFRHYLALAYLRVGRLAESLTEVALGVSDGATGRVLALLELTAAEASTAAGALEDAADHVNAARLPNASPEDELGRGWLATARAKLALAEGRLGDVRALVDATTPLVVAAGVFTDMSDTVWWLAEVGLAAEAERAERARAADSDGALEDARGRVGPLTGFVEAVRRQRDDAGIPDDGRMEGYEALIAGHVARIEGRDEPDLWAKAADLFPPHSPEAMTARYRQAEAMLIARMRGSEVREIIAPAHASAVEFGARPIASRLEEFARRARIDLRPSTKPDESVAESEPAMTADSSGPAALRARGLSTREIEVLTLVAAGYSNGEIADRLFITRKTASVHVTHILDKLGVSSRTHAATFAVRLGISEIDPD